MAMNKKEIEAMELALEKMRIAQALGWRNYVSNTIPPPTGQGFTRGFLNNEHTGRVYYAASSTVSHSQSDTESVVAAYVANTSGRGGGSQGARTLFVTRRDALMDLRMKLQIKYGKELARIDAEIEQEG